MKKYLPMTANERTARLALVSICQNLSMLGLNKGTSGNVSVRFEDGFLITPSGLAAEEMTPESMVKMQFDGSYEAQGEMQKKPSSEWRFHLDILRARTDMHAVIHTHSLHATTLSTLRRDVPAFHYMIAVAGGNTIRCAPYALFGSQLLSDYALAALQDRKACLLANHGMIAAGKNLAHALRIAVETENLCAQFLLALQVGEPYVLSEEEMAAVHQQFKGYGHY